jgi:hypothetical protein
MMQFTRLLCGLLFATLLAACGGGGGSPGATTGSSANAKTMTVALDVVDANGAPVSTVGTAQSTFARATVKDSFGNPVAGTVVTFTSDGLVTFFPASGTALTDATGVALVQVKPATATAAGAGTIKANTEVAGVAAKEGAISVQVLATGTIPTLALQIVNSTGQATNTVSALTPVYAQALVRDTTGAARSGVVVTFKADQNIARFLPESGTALTDNNGLAKVQILPATAASAGAGVLTAAAVISSDAQIETTLAFQVPQGAAVDPLTAKVANIVLLLDRSNLVNNGVETAKLTVVAVDGNNNVAPGAKVAVATDASTVFVPDSSAAVTDAQGQYTGQIGIGGDKSNRQVIVSATSNGVTKQTTLQIIGGKLTLQAVPPTPLPGQAASLNVSVLDSASSPVSASKVTLGGTVPELVGRVLTTGSDGKATTNFTAPATAGMYTISATGSGMNSGEYQLQVFASTVPPASIPPSVPPVTPTFSASPNVLSVNSAGSSSSQSTLRFLFVDGSNNGVSNVRVRLVDTTVGMGAVGASISSGSSTLYTDQSGTVTALYTAGQNPSPTNGVTIKACYSATDFTSSTDCPASVLTTLTTTGQALALSIGDDNKLARGGGNVTYIKQFAITVADSAGRAIPNAPVDISVDLTHYSKGQYAGVVTTTTTTGTGTATVSVLTTTTAVISPLDWISHLSTIPPMAWPSDTVPPGTGRVWCLNEDTNRNGIADPGENIDGSVDTNNQATLQPRKSDLIVSYADPQVTKTDARGILLINAEYSQNFATWLAYRLRVTANVQGSQGMAEREFITWFIEGDDVNGSFLQPPYGINGCRVPN